MVTRKISGRKASRLQERPGESMPQSNNAKSRLEERQHVIEEYIASLRRFMKSILRKLN